MMPLVATIFGSVPAVRGGGDESKYGEQLLLWRRRMGMTAVKTRAEDPFDTLPERERSIANECGI
jgi:hypothetical protein